jgi:hypothetical protein
MVEGEELKREKVGLKAWILMAVIAFCLIATGALIYYGYEQNFGEPSAKTVENDAIESDPIKTASPPAPVITNYTAKAIADLGGQGKVKVLEQKRNATTIKTIETRLLVNEENTSVSAPEKRIVAGNNLTMILGNETVKTQKQRSVTLIEVSRDVNKL